MARRDESNALNYFADTKTTIDKGPDIFVSIGSSLVLTCRVYTAGIRLNYLIWRRGDEVLINGLASLLAVRSKLLNFQMARFIGGENSGVELQSDSEGWFVTSIDVGTIKAGHSDLCISYHFCQSYRDGSSLSSF